MTVRYCVHGAVLLCITVYYGVSLCITHRCVSLHGLICICVIWKTNEHLVFFTCVFTFSLQDEDERLLHEQRDEDEKFFQRPERLTEYCISPKRTKVQVFECLTGYQSCHRTDSLSTLSVADTVYSPANSVQNHGNQPKLYGLKLTDFQMRFG